MMPNPRSTNKESATIERGEALFCEEKYAEALDVFQEILQADPANSAALNNAGISCGALGDIEGSFDYLHAALESDPSCAPAFFNLIDLAISCEAIESARQIFTLFHRGIAACNEKIAFKDILFSPETEALIMSRRKHAAADRAEDVDARFANLYLINQQTQQLGRSAA